MTGSGRSQTSCVWRRIAAYRPTPAMIVSLIALFVAMGGTTYAVTKLPKRSVGSLQLKKGAVHKEHIATGAVTVSKLGKGLVTSAPAGPAGPTSPVIVNEELPSDGVSYAVKAGMGRQGRQSRSRDARRQGHDRHERHQRDQRRQRLDRGIGGQRGHARRQGLDLLPSQGHDRGPAAVRARERGDPPDLRQRAAQVHGALLDRRGRDSTGPKS